MDRESTQVPPDVDRDVIDAWALVVLGLRPADDLQASDGPVGHEAAPLPQAGAQRALLARLKAALTTVSNWNTPTQLGSSLQVSKLFG